MIWNGHSATDPRESAIVSHIADEVGVVCGNNVLSTPENVKAMAAAVELFLSEKGDSSCVESKYLVMLTSRALSSVGEGAAARRLLLFGTGLVKPSEWEVSGGDSMWVLDLKQMTVRTDVVLEMVFFNSLNIVLDSIADIWDENSGRGVLGLRNVCCVAEAMIGSAAKKSKALVAAREIREASCSKLEKIGKDRGWSEIPRVVDLDA
jgi:hypothetical protein